MHPLTEYIQQQFGMHYTQDESYYILDAEPGAVVYLGTQTGTRPEAMMDDLRQAARGEKPFDDARFVNQIPAKKHDHFLIPAGTVHCSGAGTMVLEISATPYIFTFKLWDWGPPGS
ncbi:Phosphomannose isomerase [Enterobacter cancerogenus]|uniref:Phosphomannose isomerase n=1 Tax=Enterobacter cancerogenus TaxID=69218 RepID=A0A484VWV9_9ENTR|nr:Phosphomannose isomerase [Enterobacter cancerogenus]